MSQLYACKGRERVLQEVDTGVTNVLQNQWDRTTDGGKCVSLQRNNHHPTRL